MTDSAPRMPAVIDAARAIRRGERTAVDLMQTCLAAIARLSEVRFVAATCLTVAFGECLVPGYPFWVERTDGARFESAVQKSIFAHYLGQVRTKAMRLDESETIDELFADRVSAWYALEKP